MRLNQMEIDFPKNPLSTREGSYVQSKIHQIRKEEEMTREQKLLALEAILCAFEGDYPPEPLRSRIQQIHKAVDAVLEPIIEEKYPVFGDFLTAQQEAVEELATTPAVFGA